MKKVGKPLDHSFRYDLNQIPYKYTLEVTNRFKVLDLINRVLKELWTHCTGGSDQHHLQEKEMQKINSYGLLDHRKSKRIPEKKIYIYILLLY